MSVIYGQRIDIVTISLADGAIDVIL